MKQSVQAFLAAAALLAAGQAMAQITFYERPDFRGQSFTTDEPIGNFGRVGFNDRASSIVVEHGRWEVCEHARFEGRCVMLRRGSYPSLRDMGLNNTVSSVRPFEGRERRHGGYHEPVPQAAVPLAAPPVAAEWRVRPGEQVFEVPVSSVRAVVGPPNQRCWVERQQVTEAAPRGEANVGGAVIGGIVGGILGHQVGGGSGKDVATGVGAVAGAVIGSNMANQTAGTRVVNRDVQRCEQVTSAQPEYYDVTYHFRGIEHRVQMSSPPGRTVRINGNGEPRS